jgi:hypothetical protein
MKSLDTLRQYRVALAPLRFGAGLKGKVVDSWAHGLPDEVDWANDTMNWGGYGEATDAEGFAQWAVTLYTDQSPWQQSQRIGLEMLQLCFSRDSRLAAVKAVIVSKLQHLSEVRQQDYVGQMLWQQGTRATEYFSRWIELKEQLAGKA